MRTESDIKIKWNQIIRNKIEERNQSEKIHKKIEIRGINKRTTLYFGEEKREKRGRKRKKKKPIGAQLLFYSVHTLPKDMNIIHSLVLALHVSTTFYF
jgi:hypothetical protein